MSAAQWIAAISGYACLAVAAGYSNIALFAVLAWRCFSARTQPVSSIGEPVTILKPLCGSEPHLYEHLSSFCRQNFGTYQVVLGTLDARDSALPIAAQIMRDFPDHSIELVVNPQRHGHNNKTSNLINMMAKAEHDILVVSDSDTFVRSDYLSAVTGPLADPGVGLVTCLSHDLPAPGPWSRLGAMYVNEWYFPSVMLAWLFGHQGYASGQTLCLRRSTLQAVGGLEGFANHLADDYQLGHLIRRIGLRTVLSPHEVQAQHYECGWASLTRHELRWMGTLHVLRPLSFRLIFLTFSLLLAAIGMSMTIGLPGRWVAWLLFSITVAARLGLYLTYRLRHRRSLFGDLALVPVRDILTCYVWLQSFFSRRLSWRGYEFVVDSTGLMHRAARP